MGLESIVFKQERLGKNEKPFTIYKLRTMDNDVEVNLEGCMGFKENGLYGKVENDPRVNTKFKRFLRRYWIDELLQFYNIFKGEMSLVGARPLTKEMLEKYYPSDLREVRKKYKPGLVGCIYIKPVNGWKSRLASERIYFREKAKHPLLTDLRYLFKISYNIFFNGARGS